MQDLEGCTGATDLKGISGKELAAFRVFNESGMHYRSMRMNDNQRSERRIYLRKVLLDYPGWSNLSNEKLDQITIEEIKGGYWVEDEEGRGFPLFPNQVNSEESEFRKIRAMMPFDFINITAKDFLWDKYNTDTSSSRNMMNQYIMNYQEFKNKGMGLYIYSETKGSGKTMLACCLLNEITKRYVCSVKFINILDFIEMTKKGADSGSEDVKAVYQAGLLVVDDIGVQMAKEWIDTVLYRLINDRYANRLPTIYTSNLPVDGLKIDDRITDRIESTTYPIRLPDEPIRKAMRQQAKQNLLNDILNK